MCVCVCVCSSSSFANAFCASGDRALRDSNSRHDHNRFLRKCLGFVCLCLPLGRGGTFLQNKLCISLTEPLHVQDVPAWLDEARELLQFRSARMPVSVGACVLNPTASDYHRQWITESARVPLQTAKELEEQALASAAYRKKLAGSNRVVGGNVEKFHESEKVKSSTVKVSNPLNREDL